jgi:hypothetical protein
MAPLPAPTRITPHCPRCGGWLIPEPGPGRTTEARCVMCGEDATTPARPPSRRERQLAGVTFAPRLWGPAEGSD